MKLYLINPISIEEKILVPPKASNSFNLSKAFDLPSESIIVEFNTNSE